MTTTPNLGLTLPDVQVTLGPLWASLINDSFETIDIHDHTPGRGVQIPSAAININGDVSFASYNATQLRTVRFVSQGSTPSDATDLGIIYVKNGELTYKDISGNEVVITASGSVAGATGSITGLSSPASAVFSSVTKAFTFSFDSSKPGKLNISDVSFYEYNNATANPITVKSPASVGSSYSWTLPTAQATNAVELITSDNSGQLDTALLAGTANQITVTQSPSSIVLSVPATLTTTTFKAGAGSAANPSITFSADPDTGFYSTTNQINMSCGGAVVAAVDAGHFQAPTGGASAPGMTFVGNTGMGMYPASSTQLGFSTGGTSRATLDSSGLNVPLDISVGRDVAITRNLTVGATATAVGYNAGSGTIKWKTFTGSLTTGSSATLSISGTVYGAIGTSASGSSPQMMINQYPLSGATTNIYFEQTTDSTVIVRNASGGTYTYRVIVFYI